MKKDILQLDLSLLLSDAASHPSQIFVRKIASSQEGSWPKLWDLALERGVFGTTCIQAVLKLLSLHLHSNNICPVPDCNISLDAYSLCTHFLSHHSELTVSIDKLIDACVHCSDSLFIYDIIVLDHTGIINSIVHFFFPLLSFILQTQGK